MWRINKLIVNKRIITTFKRNFSLPTDETLRPFYALGLNVAQQV